MDVDVSSSSVVIAKIFSKSDYQCLCRESSSRNVHCSFLKRIQIIVCRRTAMSPTRMEYGVSRDFCTIILHTCRCYVLLFHVPCRSCLFLQSYECVRIRHMHCQRVIIARTKLYSFIHGFHAETISRAFICLRIA